MKSIQWPTAIVCLGAFAFLAFVVWRGVPAWAVALVGAIATGLAGYMESLFSGGSASGGGTVSKLPTSTSTNGPVPPTAARVILVGAALALCGCTNGIPNPQTVQDVTIGLNAAVCVFETYSTDLGAGKGEVTAIADCVAKCGVSAAQATGLLDSHRKAEVAEGFVPKPDAGK